MVGFLVSDMLLKQTFKNHLILLEFTISMFLLLFVCWWYFNYDSAILLIGGLFHSLFTLPAMFLHISYYLKNLGEEIEISDSELIIKKNGLESKFDIKDLTKIILYKSASLDKGGIPFSAMEYYSFIRIFTNSGKEIIITCLMMIKLEDVLKKFPTLICERKKGLAFLFWK